MAGLTVRADRQDGRAIIRLSGELDLATIDVLRREAAGQLAAGDVRELVLDLTELNFLDSSGLGALLQIRGEAMSGGATFTVANVPAAPARVIAIAGLNSTFGIDEGAVS